MLSVECGTCERVVRQWYWTVTCERFWLWTLHQMGEHHCCFAQSLLG
jgi:hypothetical protein